MVNDNNGDTASSENGETVDIIIDDVNSDSNNIVSGQASNSSVANHSTASMNDNSTNNNISCDISHTNNVNSSKDDNNASITWDDVVAMEDAARELEEVPVQASPPVIDPSMARTARRSDRLQQSYIPRRLTRASAKSKT